MQLQSEQTFQIMQRGQIFYRLVFFVLLGFNTGQFHAQMLVNDKNSDYTRLLHLLREKDFFGLEYERPLLNQRLAPQQQLYFQAYLDNAFNRNQEAIRHINTLLNKFSTSLPDSFKAALYLLQSDSYFKLFQYAKAAENDSILLHQYADVLDSNRIEEIKNKAIICNGLKDIPPQQTVINRRATLPWNRNKIGIVEIPVSRQRVSYDAVFDTRANISTITQTYAAKLHLKALPVSYYEGSGITGIRFKTGLAIADSLSVGNILVRNAVFQVVPDSVLYIAPVYFQINIIIGFPIIEQLREVRFYKDGRMEVPIRTKKSKLHNLALDGLNPIIALRTISGETLNFAFDFGASRSMLFAAYFNKYRQSVLSYGIKKTTEYGGAGGMQKKEVLMLPSVELYLGDKKIVLDSVDVLSEKVYAGESFYGNIGQDVISQFQGLVLNFRDMYIKELFVQ
jgi:hypothetical protein